MAIIQGWADLPPPGTRLESKRVGTNRVKSVGTIFSLFCDNSSTTKYLMVALLPPKQGDLMDTEMEEKEQEEQAKDQNHQKSGEERSLQREGEGMRYMKTLCSQNYHHKLSTPNKLPGKKEQTSPLLCRLVPQHKILPSTSHPRPYTPQ